jgi:hypothetical protein
MSGEGMRAPPTPRNLSAQRLIHQCVKEDYLTKLGHAIIRRISIRGPRATIRQVRTLLRSSSYVTTTSQVYK